MRSLTFFTESFLCNFERIAQLNNWPEDKYAEVLQTHLSGKILKIFTELSTEQCQDYATLKAALLTARSLSKRFRTISKYASETHSEFDFTLQMQFKHLTEGGDASSDIEKMSELIQLEQFREGLDSELVIWLIGQKPKTLAEAARLAGQFVAIRKSSNRILSNNTKRHSTEIERRMLKYTHRNFPGKQIMGQSQKTAMSKLAIALAEMASEIRKIKGEPEKSENLLIN